MTGRAKYIARERKRWVVLTMALPSTLRFLVATLREGASIRDDRTRRAFTARFRTCLAGTTSGKHRCPSAYLSVLVPASSLPDLPSCNVISCSPAFTRLLDSIVSLDIEFFECKSTSRAFGQGGHLYVSIPKFVGASLYHPHIELTRPMVAKGEYQMPVRHKQALSVYLASRTATQFPIADHTHTQADGTDERRCG